MMMDNYFIRLFILFMDHVLSLIEYKCIKILYVTYIVHTLVVLWFGTWIHLICAERAYILFTTNQFCHLV